MSPTTTSSRPSKKKLGVLDRVLSLATDIQAGEGALAVLLAVDVMLLLSAYYVIKPVREALILSEGSAELKSYAAVGQVLLLALLVPAYGKLTEKVPRNVLIPLVTAVFMGCFVAFYFAAQARSETVGVAFYLFVGVFNLMLVAQFWSYANDLYTKKQGERLFPIVAFGASIGAVVGSGLTSLLVDVVGVNQMLLVGTGILGATIGITLLVERMSTRQGGRADDEAGESGQGRIEEGRQESGEEQRERGGGGNPFSLVLHSRYLLLIAALMFLSNLVNTTGEFILGREVKTWAEEQVQSGATELSVADAIGSFYSEFFFWVNSCGALVQFFLVSRIIRWLGVGGALLVLPVVALGSYVSFGLFPLLAVLRVAKTAENTTDYSLNNTVRNALFLPLTKEEKYKAKQAVDTFFVRGGDVASAGVVALGLHVLNWESREFAWLNIGIVAVWILVGIMIRSHYREYEMDEGKPGEGEGARRVGT